MPKANKSKEDTINAISGAFRTFGYDGTTLSKLTEATGLERASLYHYFPKGKKQMAEVVAKKALEDLGSEVLAKLESTDGADMRLARMLESVFSFYNEGKDMCFVSIFSIGTTDTHLGQLLSEATMFWHKALKRTLQEKEIADPSSEAFKAIALIQGSLLLASLTKKPDIFAACLHALAKDWGVQLRS